MGRDKALLPFRGTFLGKSVAQAVHEAAGNVTLVGDLALAESIGYPAIADHYPGEGPLGGVLTALQHTTADWNLITACDMPELTPDFLIGLLDAAWRAGADVLMPAGPAGLPEPLCAVYRREAHEEIAAAFRGGIRKVTAAFAGLRVVQIPVTEIKPFQNVNTPEDWAGYAAG